MGTCNSKPHIRKLLLVWPTHVSDKVRAVFNSVFMDASELTRYITTEITKTDIFYLIIPLDCLEHLLNDPVYEFPQVLQIDVIYVGSSDRKTIEHRYKSKYEKLRFHSMRAILTQLENGECDKALGSSNSINRSTIHGISSSIEDRLAAKRSTAFIHLSRIMKQNASTSSHSFSVKNINDFDTCYICPSCQLVFQQPYQLKCGHRQCEICINIRKNCVICFKAVSYDKIVFDLNLKLKMQHLRTVCFGCEWKGPLKDYQAHLKEKHHEFITCYVHNRKVDESSFEQQHLSGTNQEIFHDNLPSLNSGITAVSYNGACIWRISNISDLKNNATSDTPKSVYSDPFYIFPNGYKMCLRLYINGDHTARNTHMSLFFAIMRGEYDDILPWPFKFKVTFTLIDQAATNENQYHIRQFRWPSTKEFCSECPRGDMNISNGIPMFFPLDLFEQNQDRYVENDTMFIQVEIDHSTERPISSSLADVSELPAEEEHANTTHDNLSVMICSPD